MKFILNGLNYLYNGSHNEVLQIYYMVDDFPIIVPTEDRGSDRIANCHSDWLWSHDCRGCYCSLIHLFWIQRQEQKQVSKRRTFRNRFSHALGQQLYCCSAASDSSLCWGDHHDICHSGKSIMRLLQVKLLDLVFLLDII